MHSILENNAIAQYKLSSKNVDLKFSNIAQFLPTYQNASYYFNLCLYDKFLWNEMNEWTIFTWS